tara:strand:+ start:2145 stop:3353 length:1209 start_codon:yes stop_codon:yes gene_type:complete
LSVRKRQWTTAKGEFKSAWVVDYKDQVGKRRMKSFRLKKEADAYAQTVGVEVRTGVHVADADTVTVAEAGKHWIRACEAAGLETTTIAQYKQHLNLHIVPFLGATKINKLTIPVVRAFQDELRENDRSPAMVKRVTVSLGSILGNAQEQGLVVRNAVHEMKSRRKASTAAEKRQKARLRYGVDIPTMDEIRSIISAAEGRYRPLLIVAIFTGLRASELRGLTWADLDLDKGRLHVRQRADARNSIGMPKSEAGQRTVPLPPMVVSELQQWKSVCPKGKLGLVFPNGEGNVEYHGNIINRGLHPTLMAAGVIAETDKVDADGQPVLVPKYTGMHALRHWFASWCINSKADGGQELAPKAVQARMGHSSIQVTFDTYGHLFPATDETEALAVAEKALFLNAVGG